MAQRAGINIPSRAGLPAYRAHHVVSGFARRVAKKPAGILHGPARARGRKGIPATNGNPLLALAKELNLDPVSFQKCLDTSVGKQKVAEDERDGKNAGINGTPGVIVRNNKTGRSVLMAGAVPLDTLEKQVRELLGMP